MVGASFDLSFGDQVAGIPVYDGSPECGEFQSGTASGRRFSLFGILPLPAAGVGLQTGLTYEQTSGILSTTPREPLLIFDPEGGESALKRLDRELELQSRYEVVRLSALLHFPVTTHVAVGFGVWGGYRFGTSFSQVERITGPGTESFADGQRERPMAGGSTLTPSALAWGAEGLVTYELPIGPRLSLLTVGTLSLDLGSPVSEYGTWWQGSLGGGLGVLYRLGAPPVAAVPPPVVDAPPTAVPDSFPTLAVEPPLAPARPAFRISVDLYSIDSTGSRLPAATIRVFEVHYRRRVPLLRSIYFDEGSAELAGRYMQLGTGETDYFTIDSVGVDDPLGTQHHGLNILGRRLAEMPAATITLQGGIDGGESVDLASKRAESVKRYLADIWRIRPERIIIGPRQERVANEQTEDGRAENRRVTISSNMPEVLEPLVEERIERELEPPLVNLEPSVTAEAGVQKWELAVFHGATEIARLSSDTDQDEFDLNWQSVQEGEGDDNGESYLSVEFSVVDSTGASASTSDRLRLILDKQVRVVSRDIEVEKGIERLSYSLLAFDYDTAELNERNLEIVREIASTVEPGADIRVTGYTDRIGGEQYNVKLSLRRAEHVVEALRRELGRRGITDVDLTATGGGVLAGRFDNDLPEGRALSRSVRVTVHQQVR